MNPLNNLSENARKVPAWIRICLMVPVLGLAGWWIATGTGVYYAVASYQAGLFDGEHYLVLSILLTILVPLIPAAVTVQILARVYARRDQQGSEE
ncbi:MAG: hypothetical protein H6581_20435 [Bacteroidia bacterium]|nr:hypothetical protein [Bacteroidia bacterium]